MDASVRKLDLSEKSLHYVRYSGTHPSHKISPGCTLICVLKSLTLFACTGTVASNFGDYWAIDFACSGIISYNLVCSGKQTYAISVRIAVTLTGVRIGRSFWGMEMSYCLICMPAARLQVCKTAETHTLKICAFFYLHIILE